MFFILFYAFVMIPTLIQLVESKNVYFSHIFDLVIMLFIFGIVIIKLHNKSQLFLSVDISHFYSIINFSFLLE